jgi:RNA polymerase-binding transcription factor DksA
VAPAPAKPKPSPSTLIEAAEALRALRHDCDGHPEWRAEIDAALDRIDAGSYGRCVECGNHIPAARLKAAPWAKFCSRCQDILAAMSARI